MGIHSGVFFFSGGWVSADMLGNREIGYVADSDLRGAPHRAKIQSMTERKSLNDKVFQHLRDAIMTGQLESGSLQSVYRLSAELGISRTPIREAVLRLAETGLVTVERNRGVRVHGNTVQKIREVFELRLLIEIPAAAYAAEHGSAEFMASLRSTEESMVAASGQNEEEKFRSLDRALHGLIASTFDNTRLTLVLSGLRDVTGALGAWTGNRSRDLEAIVSEHGAIVKALLARDPGEASRAMAIHLERTGTLLMQQVALGTDEKVPEQWANKLWSHSTTF